jgi:predicted DNA-binding transcriptional regulator AlpA
MVTTTPTSHEGDLMEPLLTEADLRRLLQVCDRTLRRWAASGFLPAPIRLQGRKRWHREEVRAFIERLPEGPRTSTKSDAGKSADKPADITNRTP